MVLTTDSTGDRPGQQVHGLITLIADVLPLNGLLLALLRKRFDRTTILAPSHLLVIRRLVLRVERGGLAGAVVLREPSVSKSNAMRKHARLAGGRIS